jgi:phosphonate transport system permease protein
MSGSPSHKPNKTPRRRGSYTRYTTNTSASHYRRISLVLAGFALFAFFLADIGITTRSPGTEFGRILTGFIQPDFFATEQLLQATLFTLSFAIQGVALGAAVGFLLACFWHYRPIRIASATVRAVHELFWGLIFLQLTGLSTLTGVLAIAIPYSGIFAKVFGEFLEESNAKPAMALAPHSGPLSTFFFAKLPLVWAQFKIYGAYRLECGIRSSAILGFIGLPTLGFHLETAFRQGDYSAGAALLYIFFLLIISMRGWLHTRLVPLYLTAALLYAPPLSSNGGASLWRFLSHDIIPAPLRNGYSGDLTLSRWTIELITGQAIPGLINTLVLGSAALLLTGLIALIILPFLSRHFSTAFVRSGANAFVVMMRTTPEFLLAFIFLLALGPSMLPGIFALALHTGAIIGHLTSRIADQLPIPANSTRGINRLTFEVLPRVYGNFLALLLYRWEIIMRETAILGLIGIPTIGFYIDSAFAEFRLDRAFFLIAISVILNLSIDGLSRALRKQLRLHAQEA